MTWVRSGSFWLHEEEGPSLGEGCSRESREEVIATVQVAVQVGEDGGLAWGKGGGEGAWR